MTTTTKEHGMLFSGHLVRAILDGRKTQTRRPVNLKHVLDAEQKRIGFQQCDDPAKFRRIMLDKGVPRLTIPTRHPDDAAWAWEDCGGECLYSPWSVGDRIWVRETWVELLHTSPATDSPLLCAGDKLIEHATHYTDANGNLRWRYDGRVISYRATSDVEFCDGDGFVGEDADQNDMPRWRPSIHMPRWASRITLEITDVRVQRVQEISEDDAMAEGVSGGCLNCGMEPCETTCRGHEPNYRDSFVWTWNSIYAKSGLGWEANPWVWALSFRRIESEARQ